MERVCVRLADSRKKYGLSSVHSWAHGIEEERKVTRTRHIDVLPGPCPGAQPASVLLSTHTRPRPQCVRPGPRRASGLACRLRAHAPRYAAPVRRVALVFWALSPGLRAERRPQAELVLCSCSYDCASSYLPRGAEMDACQGSDEAEQYVYR